MKAQNPKSIKINKSSTTIATENPNTASTAESIKIFASLKKVLKTTERYTENSRSPYVSAKNILAQKPHETGRLIKLSAVGKKEGLIIKDLLPGPISPHRITAMHRITNYFPKIRQYEKVSLKKKLQDINTIFSSTRCSLKNLALSDELKENEKILQENQDFKAKTWLENIISLKEKKKAREGLIEDLKFCNDIFRDLISRLKSGGNENESIVINKLWIFVLEIFDTHIDLIHENIEKTEKLTENTLKASEQVIKIKTECQKKVNKIEKEIERVKLDFILAKNPLLAKEKEEQDKIFPHIEKVYNCINDLSFILKSDEEDGKKTAPEEPAADEKNKRKRGKKIKGSIETPILNISSSSVENLPIVINVG